MSLPLRNKTAIITGASGGIGLAIAKTLARAGASTLLVARDPMALAAAARAINNELDNHGPDKPPVPGGRFPSLGGGRAVAFPGDVSRPEMWAALVARHFRAHIPVRDGDAPFKPFAPMPLGPFAPVPPSLASSSSSSTSSSENNNPTTTTTNEDDDAPPSQEDNTTATTTTTANDDGILIKGFSPRPDILVNAAGISQTSLLHKTSLEDIDALLATNLRGVVLGCRAMGELMIRRPRAERVDGGVSVVNVASVMATHGQRGASVYAASKAGILGEFFFLSFFIYICVCVCVIHICDDALVLLITSKLPHTSSGSLLWHT